MSQIRTGEGSQGRQTDPDLTPRANRTRTTPPGSVKVRGRSLRGVPGWVGTDPFRDDPSGPRVLWTPGRVSSGHPQSTILIFRLASPHPRSCGATGDQPLPPRQKVYFFDTSTALFLSRRTHHMLLYSVSATLCDRRGLVMVTGSPGDVQGGHQGGRGRDGVVRGVGRCGEWDDRRVPTSSQTSRVGTGRGSSVCPSPVRGATKSHLLLRRRPFGRDGSGAAVALLRTDRKPT